jgi:hypothetical protein
MLTKVSWENLYTKLVFEVPGGGCCGPSATFAEVDAHETTRSVVYKRSRCNRPDDIMAAEQVPDHIPGRGFSTVAHNAPR